MGLDMNIYKINRAVKNQKELEELLEIKHTLSLVRSIGVENILEIFSLFEKKDYNKIINNYVFDARKDYLLSLNKTDRENEISSMVQDLKNDFDVYKKHKDSLITTEELAYFRKHSDLHGYFEEMYYEIGGSNEFNCVPLYLDENSLKTLLDLIKNHLSEDSSFRFDKASGFFWGESSDSDWVYTQDILSKILENVDFNKETVYYSSWW